MVGRWEFERRYAAHSGREGSKSADIPGLAGATTAGSRSGTLGWLRFSRTTHAYAVHDAHTQQ